MTDKIRNSLSRRGMLRASGAITLLAGSAAAQVRGASRPGFDDTGRYAPSFTPEPKPGTGMPTEGPNTPRLCLNLSVSEIAKGGVERLLQLGVTHVTLGGVPFPFDEAALTAQVKSLADLGITVGNYGIPESALTNIVYGRPGRDKQIEDVKTSIRAAGKAGIPVLQYSLYSHRLREGYFQAPDPKRGNARLVTFDYEPVKDLPPLPEEGAHSHEELWANATYFIKAIVPTAEAANVRLAQHPNDCPGPVNRGSHQIMSTLADWKNFVAIVDSPANGIVFDCGIARELGEDPVAVARYFGERDRINQVHYRNVILRTPNRFYTETYPDMGDNNMLAVMKELVRQKYSHLIFPEHARGLSFDREHKDDDYAAWAFQVGYARAMLQAALIDR